MKKETKTEDNVPRQQHRPVLGLLVPSGLLSHDFLYHLSICIPHTDRCGPPNLSWAGSSQCCGGWCELGARESLVQCPLKTSSS